MQIRHHLVVALLCGGALMASGAVRAEQGAPATAADTANPRSANTNPVVQLSLAKALELALSQNPSARAADARVAAARAALRSAKSLQNPELSLAHGFGSGTGGLDEDILLTQTFELGAKRRSPIARARSELQAALFDRIAARSDLILSVKTAYYDALRSEQEYQLSKAALDVARQFAEAASVQFEAGDVARSNVLRAQVEQMRAEQDLVSSETERDNRYATLRNVAGVPVAADLQLTDKLDFAPADYDLPGLQVLAAANRPDIHSAQSMVESLKAAVRAAKAEPQPDAFVEGRHETLNPSTGGSSIRIGVMLPLLDLGRKRAGVAGARAALSEQQAKLDETKRSALLDVETSFNTLRQTRKLVESFQSGRLDRAKELLDMAQTGYQKGASSYLEVLDAQTVYRSEQADYTRALADYQTALAGLERAVGGKLP